MKKLPLAEPIIASSPKHTDFLTIILSDEDGYNWLYSHYVNMFFEALVKDGTHEKFSGGFVDMGVHPKNTCCLTRHDEIRYSEIEEDIVGTLIRKIDEERYIIVRLDQYYIPASEKYKKRNKMHTTMIFGYDDLEKIFYIYDFYYEHFQIATMTYEEMTEAFLNSKQDLTLIKRNDRKYKFSLKHVLALLKDYYYGTDHTGYHFNMEYTIQTSPCYVFSAMEESEYEILYGYKSTTKIIQDVCEVFPRKVLAHEIYGHKKLMVKRLEYIQKNFNADLSDEISEYKKIEKKALILSNMFLKLHIMHTELTPLNKIAYEIEEMEGNILPRLIKKIERIVDEEK